MKRMSNRLQGHYRSIINTGQSKGCDFIFGYPSSKNGCWSAGNENDAYLFLRNWYGRVHGINLNSMMTIIYGAKKPWDAVHHLLRLMKQFNDCNTVKAREFCMLHGDINQLRRLILLNKVNKSKVESLIIVRAVFDM